MEETLAPDRAAPQHKPPGKAATGAAVACAAAVIGGWITPWPVGLIPLILGSLLGIAIIGLWLLSAVSAALTVADSLENPYHRVSGRARWLVIPVLAVHVIGFIWADSAWDLRFHLSRTALRRAATSVETVPDTNGARWLGLVRVRRIYTDHDVVLLETGSLLGDTHGYAWSDRPLDSAEGLAYFYPLEGGWYRYIMP